MTTIEDRLTAAARELRHKVAGEVDVDAAMARVTRPSHPRKLSATRRGPLLVAAVMLVAIAVTAAVLATGGADERNVVTDGPTPTSTDEPSPTSTDEPSPTTPEDPTVTTPNGPTVTAPDQPTPTTEREPSDGEAAGETETPPGTGIPGLQKAEPGRQITFDGVGDVRLDQVLDPSAVTQYEADMSCGFWGPMEPSHDGDEPLTGLVAGADGPTPRVRTIMVRENPTYRTASGVGVGTPLDSLRRVYGDDLVVDRTDAGITPTDGLLGQYQDVAAVRYQDRAITFYLSDDVVRSVKVSGAQFWGDDEGCA